MTGRAGGIARGDITFGILAGGRATRLGGRDKAWLERDGVAQVLRLIQRFGAGTGAVLVSANRAHELAKVELMQTLQLDPRGEYAFAPPALCSAMDF